MTSRVPRFPVHPGSKERLAGATGLHPRTSRVPRFPSHPRAKEMPPLGATGPYPITALYHVIIKNLSIIRTLAGSMSNSSPMVSFSAETEVQMWAIDRQTFQTIMMKTGMMRQKEHMDFLKR